MRLRGRRPRLFRWHSDSRRLLFLRDRQGDENDHLYVVDTEAETPKALDLTPFPGVKVKLRRRLLDDPVHVLISMNRRDRSVFDLFRLNIATGKLTLLGRNPGAVERWITDRKGRVVARTRTLKSGQWVLEVPGKEAGQWRVITTGAFDEHYWIYDQPPDDSFVWALSYRGSDTLALVKLDLRTGKETLRYRHPTLDLEGVGINLETYEPLFVNYRAGLRKRHYFDKALERDIARFRPKGPATIGFPSVSRDWRRMVVAVHTDRTGSALYLFDRDSGKKTLLRAHPIAKYRDDLAPMVPVSFAARDGLRLQGFLTLPKGGSRNLPMVLKVHGGPWWWDRWGYDHYTQFLANRGYAVLSVNYRGSIGYGLKFRRALRGEFAKKAHTDLIDAVNWAVKNGIADPKRVAIYGRSYGGYAALVGMTFTPDVFAAGVSVVGISDLVTTLRNFPPYWKPWLARWYAYAGDPWTKEGEADLAARSPLNFVDRVRGPILIGQGANDVRVIQDNAELMVAALKKAGKTVEYILFDDEGHWIVRRRNRLELAERIEAFLAKHLGGRSELGVNR